MRDDQSKDLIGLKYGVHMEDGGNVELKLLWAGQSDRFLRSKGSTGPLTCSSCFRAADKEVRGWRMEFVGLTE
jgi:hypothetical protein